MKILIIYDAIYPRGLQNSLLSAWSYLSEPIQTLRSFEERTAISQKTAFTPEGIRDALFSQMTDDTTVFSEIKSRVRAFTHERDWEQFHSPKNLSMALAAEAAELMEHYLWSNSEDSRQSHKEPAKRAKIEEELADVLIYAIEFSNMTGIDLASAIENKIALNARKYPVEKAKGKSLKYTEL